MEPEISPCRPDDLFTFALDLAKVQAIRAGVSVSLPISDPERAIAALDDAESILEASHA